MFDFETQFLLFGVIFWNSFVVNVGRSIFSRFETHQFQLLGGSFYQHETWLDEYIPGIFQSFGSS
jgi:hypothetical protein